MKICALRPASPEGSNCWFLWDDGHAVVVDPSASVGTVQNAVKAHGCVLDAVLLTHGHFDHIVSVDALRAAFPGLRVLVHPEDAPMLTDGDKNAHAFFFGEDKTYAAADGSMVENDVLTVGNARLRVLHTPGHSPGSVCLYDEADGILVTGDTLFAMSVGRWDLWRGDYDTLRASLRRLRALMGEKAAEGAHAIMIYPGHDCVCMLGLALARAARMGL